MKNDTRVTLILKMLPDHLKRDLRNWTSQNKSSWLAKAPLGLVASDLQKDNCQWAGLCTHNHTRTLLNMYTPEGPEFFAQGDACSL
jgi:hypothetical protein